jgi:CDP-diacylglycerol--glycerol-3-phosphate 3-phosphatidyltransferase
MRLDLSPNAITLARLPMLLASVAMLYRGTPGLRLAAAALVAAGLLLDTADGIVARRTGRTTLLGSVLDIAADRAYELTLWLVYADLDLVPAAIPVIVIVRTTLTDALRAVGVAAGEAPFAQARSGLARRLVSGAPMRTAYSGAKLVAFTGLALALALGRQDWLPPLRAVAWIALGLCLARGAPVLAGLAGVGPAGATAAGSTAARSR